VSDNREAIPEEIKRQVRQKCGFGCVVCGLPIYQYDHVTPFAITQRHDVDNIILLCPNHHQDKTSGRLPEAEINRAKANPRNIGTAFSSPYRFYLNGDRTTLFVGGNEYSYTFSEGRDVFDAIRVFDQTIIGVKNEGGSLLLNLALTDSKGAHILIVKLGELIVSTQVWDYQIEGASIRVRSKAYKVELVLTLHNDGVKIERGYFVTKNVALIIRPDFHEILPNRITMRGCKFDGCRVGLEIS